ncbi:hypothetical protein VI817_003176 [Penicillium citrinum]|nr:hypothetical protein VI817_003176 [Penicillium citrinum]
MPPIRSQNRPKLAEQEGQILLTIKAIEKQEKLSSRRTAQIYNIPRTALQDRLNGRQNRVELRANSTKLIKIEENSLKDWIISMDIRGLGLAPRPSIVQEMGNILPSEAGKVVIQCLRQQSAQSTMKKRKVGRDNKVEPLIYVAIWPSKDNLTVNSILFFDTQEREIS